MPDKNKVMQRLNSWVRPEIRALTAYPVASSQGMIKLDAMENPYRWPDELIGQWLACLQDVEINRYPDPNAQELKHYLRQVMQLPEDSAMLLGNGSDELIQMILMAVSGSNRTVLSPEPSFVMYSMTATYVGMRYHAVSLNDDFSLNTTALLDAIARVQPAVIFLAYPNNPTGNVFDDEAIRTVIKAAPGLVIIDEAYHAFAGRSYLDAVASYDHVLVMRTMSKMGLAGLRLGVLVGNANWLHEFDKVRLPYNINVLTQASVSFALQHYQVLTQQTERICRDRERLFQALRAIPGLHVFPSHANFILLRTPAGQAQRIFEGLKRQKILIKNLSRNGGLLTDCLRVTVGTEQENNACLNAIRVLLQA